jgi:hypothetical protein
MVPYGEGDTVTKIKRSKLGLVRSAFLAALVMVLLAACGRPAGNGADVPAAPVTVTPVASATVTPVAPVTVTPAVTATPSETPLPPRPATTGTPPTATAEGSYTSYAVSPLGVHAWAYTVPTLQQYPHACMAGVLVPGDLIYHGISWEELDEACAWVGPAESVLERLSGKLRNHRGSGAPINLAIYVPEWTDYGDYGQPGSGVSIAETTELEAYLEEAIEVARDAQVTLAYGPATALVASDWEWGHSYTLDVELITELAARLRSDDLWIIRPMQMQFMYPPGPDFARAIAEYIDAVRAGNPSIAIWVHLALMDHEDAGAEYLAYRESLMHLDVAGTYMGVASGTTPELHPGTLRAMSTVLQMTAPD